MYASSDGPNFDRQHSIKLESKNLNSNLSSNFNSNDASSASLLIPVELRKYERCRLDSFKEWPPESGMDPKRLAKAGFYSTGIKDQVKCFSCHGIIENWQFGDVAIAKHKIMFPQCLFIRGQSDNVPLNAVSCTVVSRCNRAKKNNTDSDNADKLVQNSSFVPIKQHNLAEGPSCSARGCSEPNIVKKMAPNNNNNNLKVQQHDISNGADISNVNNIKGKCAKHMYQKPGGKI